MIYPLDDAYKRFTNFSGSVVGFNEDDNTCNCISFQLYFEVWDKLISLIPSILTACSSKDWVLLFLIWVPLNGLIKWVTPPFPSLTLVIIIESVIPSHSPVYSINWTIVSNLEPVKFCTVKYGWSVLMSVSKPGNWAPAPTYCEELNSLLLISKDLDVKVTEPVK